MTSSSDQTEIIMLLTPHIVRTQELTASDLQPIYIGSQQNLGVGGPPPLISALPDADASQPTAAAPPAGAPQNLPALVGPGGVQVTRAARIDAGARHGCRDAADAAAATRRDAGATGRGHTAASGRGPDAITGGARHAAA